MKKRKFANMHEVVIYFDNTYSRNATKFVNKRLSKEEVTKFVNDFYGTDGWYSYDIF